MVNTLMTLLEKKIEILEKLKVKLQIKVLRTWT